MSSTDPSDVADTPPVRAADWQELLTHPYGEAIRYFERSAVRTESDAEDCESGVETTVYVGDNHIGLRLRSSVVTPEVKAVVDTGLQYLFQGQLDVDQSVLIDALGKSVLPALMPINVAWLIAEFRVMEVNGNVHIPFTDAYAEIEEGLRKSLEHSSKNPGDLNPPI